MQDVKRLLSTRSALNAATLDALHHAGIEIVSPSFMNTRALPEERRVLPPESPQADQPSKPEQAPEAVVFDKAEEVEKTENLTDRQRTLEEEIKTQREGLKSTKSDEERAELESRITQLETAHQELGRAIEQANRNERT
ncbi:MAG: hypothetical protein OEM62_10580 [Acidobacteriota bacterium]|nr:hypothetical protein [Acidobacteriota bacterium]